MFHPNAAFVYLVISDGHIRHAELKDGLSGSHVQRRFVFAQQQSGVVEDPGLRKLHQTQIWTFWNKWEKKMLFLDKGNVTDN